MHTEFEYKQYGSDMYWAGVAVGAIGMLTICLVIGFTVT
jgi:hypothetical protein